MSDLIIKISGLGGSFDLETEYIKRLLEEMGYHVKMSEEKVMEDELFHQMVKKRREDVARRPEVYRADLIIVEYPWGG